MSPAKIFACLVLALSTTTVAAAEKNLEPAVTALKQGDAPGAVKYLLPMAKAGNAEAQFMLVSALQGIDQKLASSWLLKAARNRHPSACHILGLMYLHGNGVAEDPQQARKWLTVAAEGGIVPAQLQLGMLYRNGPNSIQDDREAAKWVGKAAVAGDAEAQYQLAAMYRFAYGVNADAGARRSWLERAAKQAHVKALQELAELSR
ncbi:hypothetical protein BH11PSE11_BH11PSE11_06050 [soil metagenome]